MVLNEDHPPGEALASDLNDIKDSSLLMHGTGSISQLSIPKVLCHSFTFDLSTI